MLGSHPPHEACAPPPSRSKSGSRGCRCTSSMDASSLNPVQLDVVWRDEYRKAAFRKDHRHPEAEPPPWVVARETSEIVPLGINRSSPSLQRRAAAERGRFEQPRSNSAESTTLKWPPQDAFRTDANGSPLWPPAKFETVEPARRASGFTNWQRPMRSVTDSREWWMGGAEKAMQRTSERRRKKKLPRSLSRDSSLIDEERLATVTALWEAQQRSRQGPLAESLRVGYKTKSGFASAKPVALEVPKPACGRASLGCSVDSTRTADRRRAARELQRESELKRKSGAFTKFAMEPLFSAGEKGGPDKRSFDY